MKQKRYAAAWLSLLLLCAPAMPVVAQESAHGFGDINGDGAPNASDASEILIESALRGSGAGSSFTTEQEAAADLDGNGQINAADAASLLTFSASAGSGSRLTIDDYVYQLRLPVHPRQIPAFSGEPYTILHDGKPYFSVSDYDINASFETYAPFDSLERCQVCTANIGQDIMPTEARGEIGMVKPTGWHTVRYDGIVEGNYLYNRCHLIGFQLAGENANVLNLITGTRYLNVQGMLPFENIVANYVETTGNHVLYRVTPLFEEDELLARGVLMEGCSVEDGGEGVSFCVYCYNVQPGITIDYATGESCLAAETPSETTAPTETTSPATETTPAETSSTTTTATTIPTASTTQTTTAATTATTIAGGLSYDAAIDVTYICNTNTRKFHVPECAEVSRIKEEHRFDVSNSKEDIEAAGYVGCKRCNP